MSTQAQLKDQEQRIAEELEDKRESLERIAETDTDFGERAASALEWLAEHQEGENGE